MSCGIKEVVGMRFQTQVLYHFGYLNIPQQSIVKHEEITIVRIFRAS